MTYIILCIDLDPRGQPPLHPTVANALPISGILTRLNVHAHSNNYEHCYLIPHAAGEYSVTSTSLTFPVGATQGYRECFNVSFVNDDTIEGLECFAAHVLYGVSHFVPVCALDSIGKDSYCTYCTLMLPVHVQP